MMLEEFERTVYESIEMMMHVYDVEDPAVIAHEVVNALLKAGFVAYKP
jgi:hypothetical protein